MRKITVFVAVILSLLLVVTGCSKSTTSETSADEQTTEQSGGDAVLGESKDIFDGHGPVGDPDPTLATEQPINEDVKGYRANNLHLSYTKSGDTYTVELSFDGLTGIEHMTEESSGRAHYYSIDNSFGVAYYTADFEGPHELYNYRFDADSWEIVEYLSAKYVDGESVAFESTLTEEQIIQMSKNLFEIMQKELSKRGQKIS